MVLLLELPLFLEKFITALSFSNEVDTFLFLCIQFPAMCNVSFCIIFSFFQISPLIINYCPSLFLWRSPKPHSTYLLELSETNHLIRPSYSNHLQILLQKFFFLTLRDGWSNKAMSIHVTMYYFSKEVIMLHSWKWSRIYSKLGSNNRTDWNVWIITWLFGV